MHSSYLTFLLPLLIVKFAAAGEVKPLERFNSPSGKISVGFRPIGQKQFAKPTEDIDEVDWIKYSITFSRGSQPLALACEYTDVYGWSDTAKPTPKVSIFNSFSWSPKEDFVILPEENGASAPASPYRKTQCLNRQLPWIDGTLHMEIKGWADDLRVFGDIHDDCNFMVVLFDGSSGRQDTIRKGDGQAPIGYEIASIKTPTVLIRKMLDNCKTEEYVNSFVESCESLDFTTMKITTAPCLPMVKPDK